MLILEYSTDEQSRRASVGLEGLTLSMLDEQRAVAYIDGLSSLQNAFQEQAILAAKITGPDPCHAPGPVDVDSRPAAVALSEQRPRGQPSAAGPV